MARLENLRVKVVDLGLIPRRSADGLPTEVYYLKVKELQDLLDFPDKAGDYLEVARARSKKRRRKKYLKEKALAAEFALGGHTNRLKEVLDGKDARCLGFFVREKRFMSATGFERAASGFVYLVGGKKVLITSSEAHRADLEFNIERLDKPYTGEDLEELIWNSGDRVYKGLYSSGGSSESFNE